MPDAMLPPGYGARLLGAVASLEELGEFTPLEEGIPEGALMLLRLDFADYPSAEALSGLNEACRDAGVPAWPGYEYIVYADLSRPSVYIAWQKGIAFLPIIIGLIGAAVLPPLLGSFAWWVTPDPIKQLIQALLPLGMMFLVMLVMRPLTAPKRRELEAR